METQRLMQFFALGLVLLLIWSAWERDYGPQPSSEPASVQEESQREPSQFVPDDLDAEGPGASEVEDSAPEAPTGSPVDDGREIRVETDLLDVAISTHGGELRRVDLLQYPVSTNDPTPLRLMSSDPARLFVARAGVVTDTEDGGPGSSAAYRPEQDTYQLDEGQNELVVPLVWEGEDGLRVTKRYTFHRDSYIVDVEHVVENGTGRELNASQQTYLRRSADHGDGTSWFIYTYTGGVLHSPEEQYRKIAFEDMGGSSALDQNVENGWLAMIQHYFIGAWLPPEGEVRRYWSQSRANNVYDLGMNTFWRPVEVGASEEFGTRLYVGPKEQGRLDAAAPALRLTVDYGWLTIISRPLFTALKWIHSVVGNWGVSIILLTLAIKLVFYKLSETSFRSMARMRKMQPRMQQLKERYGDDRQAMNQAMMKLYKEEKINPLGGCLPILVQIPVFIALYWVLLESVELRQAPFMLWIQDLSTPDPYYVLPLLMGVSMFTQQKLNPAPLDPIQQKVMMALPVVFTVFFMLFPAGLVLYWVVNNVLSIAQQWFITRRIEKGAES